MISYTDPCTIALSFMRYSVHCPSAPYENSSFVDIDDAWGLCLDLSEEFGYAEVRQGEHLLGSYTCLLYTSPSPRDGLLSRMPSSA